MKPRMLIFFAVLLSALLLTANVTPTPSNPVQKRCPGALPSRLQVGNLGMVSLDPDLPNRVRRQPDLDAKVIGQLQPGEKFTVLDGPFCANGWAWWLVRSLTQDLEGWTLEGNQKIYWLEPVANPTPTPTRTPTRYVNAKDCIVPLSGQVGWWPAQGDAVDMIGENDGTLKNGVTFTGGMAGQSFSFDGKSNVSASTAGFPTGKSNRTLELWVKVNRFADVETFFAGYGKFMSSEQTYHLGTTGSTLFFSEWGQAVFGPKLQTGRWYHVAVTNTGNTITLYLDGSAVAWGRVPLNTPANTQLYVGKLPVDPGKRLDGQVDEVGIYNRALSAAEIKSIFLAGSSGKCWPEMPLIVTPSPTTLAIYPTATPTPGKGQIARPQPTSTPVVTGLNSSSPLAASLRLHLIGNAWSGIFLGESQNPWGYLVDVTPLEKSIDGAHIETFIQTWFDGKKWVDYLFVGLPHPGISLDVQVDIYLTQGWPIAFQNKVDLEAAGSQQINLGKSTRVGAYILDINPLKTTVNAPAIIPSAVLPEFTDGSWWDVERLALIGFSQPVQAEIIAYQAPDLPVSTIKLHLEPGVWHGVGLGPASQEQAYLLEVDPLSPGQEGFHLEKAVVQPEFDGTTWNDVLRVMIPQGQPALDVTVKVYRLAR